LKDTHAGLLRNGKRGGKEKSYSGKGGKSMRVLVPFQRTDTAHCFERRS